MNKLAINILVTAVAIFSMTAHADSLRTDFDLDNDGLIEIYDVEDFYGMDVTWTGSSLIYGKNDGCPDGHCIGYELVNDIDFLNGLSEAGPFYPKRFNRQVFEGNGFALKNIRISQSEEVGVFSALYESHIRNLTIDLGENVLNAGFRVGVIAADSYLSSVVNCTVRAKLRGTLEVGGLFGVASKTFVMGTHFEGEITGGSEVGGFMGIGDQSLIYASSVKAKITSTYDSDYFLFAFVGNDHSTRTVASYAEVEFNHPDSVAFPRWGYFEASYAITRRASEDVASVALVNTDNKPGNVRIITKEQLACPSGENSESCDDVTMFPSWGRYVDERGRSVWEFLADGTPPQIRTDLQFSAQDDDGDGVPNLFDAFPSNRAAWLDQDMDGLPEAWDVSCNDECRNDSGLELDDDEREYFPLAIHVPPQGEQSEEENSGAGNLSILSLALAFLVSVRRRRLRGWKNKVS